MTKTTSSSLGQHLAGEVTTLATCWQITRRDGVVQGFTDDVRDLEVGGMLDGAMLVWFVPTGASLLFVVWDSLTNGVTSWVQRAAWILITAYTGPVGALLGASGTAWG